MHSKNLIFSINQYFSSRTLAFSPLAYLVFMGYLNTLSAAEGICPEWAFPPRNKELSSILSLCELPRQTIFQGYGDSLAPHKDSQNVAAQGVFTRNSPAQLLWNLTLILCQVTCSSHLCFPQVWSTPPVPHYLRCVYIVRVSHFPVLFVSCGPSKPFLLCPLLLFTRLH